MISFTFNFQDKKEQIAISTSSPTQQNLINEFIQLERRKLLKLHRAIMQIDEIKDDFNDDGKCIKKCIKTNEKEKVRVIQKKKKLQKWLKMEIATQTDEIFNFEKKDFSDKMKNHIKNISLITINLVIISVVFLGLSLIEIECLE